MCLPKAIFVALILSQPNPIKPTPDPISVVYLYPVQNIKVLDGDTIRADIVLPYDVTLRSKTIRCLDFDAPEISRKRQSVDVTDAEIQEGLKAKGFAVTIMATREVFIEPNPHNQYDLYGRILGRLYYKENSDLIQFADTMKSKGFVRKVTSE